MGPLVGLASMVILMIMPIVANTQEIDLSKIKPVIIGAAEELRDAWMRSDLTIKEYLNAMEISCNALTELSRDGNFENLLRVYQTRQYDERLASEVRETFLNFRSFLEFLVIERDLLLEAGMSEAAVDELLGQIMAVRLEAVGYKLDADALLTDLRGLARQACAASENVSESVKSNERWCNIRKYGVFALGATAAIVDGAAFLVPIGITQAGAGASIAAGGVLMGGAGMMPQC
jgi:hypothetical protein